MKNERDHCAGCDKPLAHDETRLSKDGLDYCSPICAEMIPGLRGMTRMHLASASEHFDVFIETCHQASPKNKERFAINGSRYVVLDNRTNEEYPCSFPNEVESLVKKLGAMSPEELTNPTCPGCQEPLDVEDEGSFCEDCQLQFEREFS